MKVKNHLRQFVDSKVEKINSTKQDWEIRHSARQELLWLSNEIGVSFSTVSEWYYNRKQPQDHHKIKLVSLYKAKLDNFFYIPMKINVK